MNFSEQLIASALQSMGHFVIQGIKVGVREADFLTIKKTGNDFEYSHIEASISHNPVGVLRKNASFRNSEKDIIKSADEFIDKKFFQPKLCTAIKDIFGSSNYKRIFIYGRLKNSKQLKSFQKRNIICLNLQSLINDAKKSNHKTNEFVNFYKIFDLMSVTKNKQKSR